MNNEISKLKTPTIVGKSKMTRSVFENMTETMHGSFKIETQQSDIIMINPNKQEFCFRLIVVPRYTSEAMAYESHIVDINCQATIHFDNDIYTGPDTYGVFEVKDYENFDAKLYYTQKAYLVYAHCKNLNNHIQ